MELDTYISTTLQQIVGGVQEAQEAMKGGGAKVNPSRRSLPPHTMHADGMEIQDIEFDIVVTVADEKKSGGGLRVGIPGVGAGLEGGSSSQHSAENRIRFKVPLVLPVP